MKVMKTVWPVDAGTRTAGKPDIDTLVTWPPMAPEETGALAKSLLVDTVMPVALLAVKGPIVIPFRVKVILAAAAKLLQLLVMTKLVMPGVEHDKHDESVFGMGPLAAK